MQPKELVDSIMEYESDTFFAKGAGLKRSEARKMAARLIDIMMDQWVDGCILDELLDEIRETQ